MENSKFGMINPDKNKSTVFNVDYLYPEEQKPKSEVEIYEEFKIHVKKQQSIEIKLVYAILAPLLYYQHRKQYRKGESLLVRLSLLVILGMINLFIFIPAVIMSLFGIYLGFFLGIMGISLGIAYYMVKFFFSLFKKKEDKL